MAEQVIISNPKIMMGQPVVSGTRLTVDLILEELLAGESFAQLLNASAPDERRHSSRTCFL